MKHGNLSQTDQNQTKRESDTLAVSMANHAGSLIIKRTVISPAWFLIFIQIYELEESIYP